jgi:predicted nucleic-acid-binding protein
MIGLDTNVLLRWLIAPDEWDIGSTKGESALVSEIILSPKSEFFVNPIVIAETTWILEQKLKLDREDVCEVVDRLLYSVNIVVGDAEAVRGARDAYEAVNIGFADCLIGRMNMQASCSYTLTFDKKAGRSTGYRNIHDERG